MIKAVDKPLRQALNWRRCIRYGQFTLRVGCSSVELGAASSPRYDLERFGVLETFGSLRQCNLIIVLGRVNRKMVPRLRVIYD